MLMQFLRLRKRPGICFELMTSQTLKRFQILSWKARLGVLKEQKDLGNGVLLDGCSMVSVMGANAGSTGQTLLKWDFCSLNTNSCNDRNFYFPNSLTNPINQPPIPGPGTFTRIQCQLVHCCSALLQAFCLHLLPR